MPSRRLRILMTTGTQPGHFWPMAPLGWALQAAGHEVEVGCLPDLAPLVTAAGLTARVVGHGVDLEAILADLGGGAGGFWSQIGDLRGLVRWNARAAIPLIDGLLESVRVRPPDVIVHPPTELAGPLFAGLLGRPAVLHPFGLPLRPAVISSFRTGGSALRNRYGLPDRPGDPSLLLDFRTPSLAATADRPDSMTRSLRYIPYGGPAIVPDWVREPSVGRRVLLAFGTETPAPESVARLAETAEAVAGDGVEVVLPLPADLPAEQRPAVGPDVRIVEWSALSVTASHCDLLLHSGEAGSTFTALSAGVPQVAIPTVAEETRHAGALEGTGAGRSVRWDRPLSEVAAAVRRVLDEPAYPKAASALAEEMRQLPAPSEAVGWIEELTQD